MNSQRAIPSIPHLTAQQLKFVKAMLDGKTRMDAYRSSYNTHAPSRSASVQAYRLWKNPKIQAAIALGQKGDAALLISCGFDLETCLVRKHLAVLQNPAVPPYVQQRMLRDLWAIVQRKQALAESEKKTKEASPAIEEIEALLGQNNGRAWDENLAATEEDDELSLDDDPLPVSPVKRNAGFREQPGFATHLDKELDRAIRNRIRDQFSTGPAMNRGLIRRFPNL